MGGVRQVKLEGDALIILELIVRSGSKRPSYDDMGDAIGCRTPGRITRIVRMLKERGLVTWETNKKRTLMPTCRFIPESELP